MGVMERQAEEATEDNLFPIFLVNELHGDGDGNGDGDGTWNEFEALCFNISSSAAISFIFASLSRQFEQSIDCTPVFPYSPLLHLAISRQDYLN